MTREEVIQRLHATIQLNGHILSVAAGSGLTAQYVIKGGADLILAINAGRFRQMGLSAFPAFFGCYDTNQSMIELATRELLPMAEDFPVIFGTYMQDPCIHLYDFFNDLKRYGFSGVINYPTVGCLDGQFRQALEDAGLGYEREIEGIRLAHFLNLFTVAYVFDEEQAIAMVEAGADAISLHFGITGGGILGANKVISMEMALKKAKDIFQKVDAINPHVIKMVNGGPILTPIDTQLFYQNSSCQGFVCGSAVERLPVERAMLNTVRAFKSQGDFSQDNIVAQVLNGTNTDTDYGDFMVEYIHHNYSKYIRLNDLALVTHLSASRLSVIFKEKTGIPFSQYLIEYRMKKACEYMRNTSKQMKEISILTGYEDYSQFVKMFRKVVGITPQEYRKKYRK